LPFPLVKIKDPKMDQILFLFDLDQLLPLEGPIAEESKQDARLSLVKQTCLRILTYCSDAGRINSKRRDLPCFGFRFYSSTEYFSLPNQLTGDFHELSKGTFDILESALTERFERVVQGALTDSYATPDFFTKHENNAGRKSESETLQRSLEEIVALYNWDRPALHSPVKKGQKTDQRIGNAVFIFTKLPNSEFGLRKFLPSANRKKKLITFKDVSDCVSSKRIKSVFNGQSNISVHVVDTSHFHNCPLSEPITTLFQKALQEHKGGVIPVQALTERCLASDQIERISLECSAQTQLGVPFSSVLKSYLSEATIPSKQLERNYSVGKLNLGDTKIGVGFPAEEARMCFGGDGIEALRTVGLVRKSLFKPGQAWSGMVTIWGGAVDDATQLQSVLSYLYYSGQCLLFEKQDGLVVLFYKDVLCGSLAFLNKIDSCFYRLLLKLKCSQEETSPLQQQVSNILTSKTFPPIQFSPTKKSTLAHEKKNPQKFDTSSLEPYRLPDVPCKNFLDKLKKGNRPNPPCEFLLKVRESYIQDRTGGVLTTGSNTKKKIQYDLEKRAIPKADRLLNKNSFEKKLSADSLSSHTSKSSGSRPLAMSRGAAMRAQAKHNPKPVAKSADSSKAIAEKDRDMVQAEKAHKTQSIIDRVDIDTDNTETLIDQLVVIKDELVAGGDATELACCAEATVSILLKHLDTVGISKTNLEEVVGTKLLFDVVTISRRYGATDVARIAEHKVQVLFRAEVHWLLARKESLEAYENEILQHLRQISLYGSPQQLTSFLNDVMVECYIARQPELLCTLFDELNQERPPALTALFSPGASMAGSVGPSSGKSSVASYISCSSQLQQVKNKQKPAFNRTKSFDSRQINLGAAANKRALKREKSMISTTGRMVTKAKSGMKAKVLANPLKQVGKSPKKAVKKPENVKRVLAFDGGSMRVASRKTVAAPCKKGTTTPRKKDKSRSTPKKHTTPRKMMTPGKQHRMLAPETPTHKITRRKSDGQVLVPETPDHVLVKQSKTTPRRTQASVYLRRKASFYSGAGSRNAQRAEESMNASLIQGNVGNQSMFANFNDSARRDSLDTSGGELNKSSILFPHLVKNKKRKWEDEDDEDKSPVRTVKRRLQSFSEDADGDMFGYNEGDQLFGDTVEKSTLINTPRKQINMTPNKFGVVEDLFSPNKKVQFNMVPMHPTPTRSTLTPKAKGILKTPNKDARTPNKTLNFGTPSKSNQSVPAPQNSFLTSTSKYDLGDLLHEAQRSPKVKIQRLNLTPVETTKSPKKTPVKSSLLSAQVNQSLLSPSANTRQSTQSPLAVYCSSKTPTKSPQRRANIGASASRSIPIFKTPNKSPPRSARKDSEQENLQTPTKLSSSKADDNNPTSPIIKSSGKGKRFKSPMSSAWTSVSPRSEPKISINQLMEMQSQDRTPTPPRGAARAKSASKMVSRSLMQNTEKENKPIASLQTEADDESPKSSPFNPTKYSTTRDIGPSLDKIQQLIGETNKLTSSIREVSLPAPSLPFPDLTSDIGDLAESLVEPDIPDVLADTEDSSVIAEFSSPLRQDVDILSCIARINSNEKPPVLGLPRTPVKMDQNQDVNFEFSSPAKSDKSLTRVQVVQYVSNMKPVRVSLSNLSSSLEEDDLETDGASLAPTEHPLGATYIVENSNNSANDEEIPSTSPFKPPKHSTSRDLGSALDAIQPMIDETRAKKNLSVIQEVSLEESSSSCADSTSVGSQLPVEEKLNKKAKVPKELAGLKDLLTEYFSPPTDGDGRRKSRCQVTDLTPDTTPRKNKKEKVLEKIQDDTNQKKSLVEKKPSSEVKSVDEPTVTKRRSKGYVWVTEENDKASANVEPSGRTLSRRRSSVNYASEEVTDSDQNEKEELPERKKLTRRKSSLTHAEEDRSSNTPNSLSRRGSRSNFDPVVPVEEPKTLPKKKSKGYEWILEPSEPVAPSTDGSTLTRRKSSHNAAETEESCGETKVKSKKKHKGYAYVPIDDEEVNENDEEERMEERKPPKRLPRGYAYIAENGDNLTQDESKNKKILSQRRASFNNIEEKPLKAKSLTRRKSCLGEVKDDVFTPPIAKLKKHRGYVWTPEKETVEIIDDEIEPMNEVSPAERAKLRRANLVNEKGDDVEVEEGKQKEVSGKKSLRRKSSINNVKENEERDSNLENVNNTYSTPQLKKYRGYAWVPKTPQEKKDCEDIPEENLEDLGIQPLEEDVKFECDTCDCDFSSKLTLDAHKVAHFALGEASKEPKDNEGEKVELYEEVEHSRWNCQYCKKYFKTRDTDLRPHIKVCPMNPETELFEEVEHSKWICQYCNKFFKTRDTDLRPHVKVCPKNPYPLNVVQKKRSIDTPLEQDLAESKLQSSEKLPKVLAALQDNLSGYFSPHDGVPRSRRGVERLADEIEKNKQESGPTKKVRRLSGKPSPSSQENTNPLLQKRRKSTKETPKKRDTLSSVPKRVGRTASNDSDSSCDSRRRSVRGTPRPSYADFDDCELLDLMDADVSPTDEKAEASSSPRTPTTSLAKNPKRFRLASGSRSGNSNKSDKSDSPSVKEHFRETKRGSRRLSVKTSNDSPVMKDVAEALESSMEVEREIEEQGQVTPEKEKSPASSNLPFDSPGKYNSLRPYFELGARTESPGGHIKMKLIRTPQSAVRRGNPIRPNFSSSHGSSKSRSTSQHPISRLSRSACKDIGISPNKLNAIRTAASPSPRKNSETAKAKEEAGVIGTPRIKLKKMKSIDQENVNSWTSSIMSPKKPESTVGSPLRGISRLESETPAKKSYSDLMADSPARKAYSPLSSNSLAKLTMSPIIHTTIAEDPEEENNEQEPTKKKRRVNKQLYA